MSDLATPNVNQCALKVHFLGSVGQNTRIPVGESPTPNDQGF